MEFSETSLRRSPVLPHTCGRGGNGGPGSDPGGGRSFEDSFPPERTAFAAGMFKEGCCAVHPGLAVAAPPRWVKIPSIDYLV